MIHNVKLSLDNMKDREGLVKVTLTGPNAAVLARWEEKFLEAPWVSEDDDSAYCKPIDGAHVIKEARDWIGGAPVLGGENFDQEYEFKVELDTTCYDELAAL